MIKIFYVLYFTSFTPFKIPLDVVAGILNGVIIAVFTHCLLSLVKPINITNGKTNFPSTKWMKDWLAMEEYIVLVH